MKLTKLAIKASKFLLVLLVGTCFSAAAETDENLKLLGNPYKDFYSSEKMRYARNIWDMQLFGNKIFLGAGNSTNNGPAPNAGRLPIFFYDLSTEQFDKNYTIAEEQVDLFKVLNQQLMVPGHDATQKWTFGNIYLLEDSKWTKRRSLAHVLHIYDLNWLDGKLFAAVGLNGSGGVYVSKDKGKSWVDFGLGHGRVYAFIKIQDQLFATRTFQPNKKDKVSVFQWNDSINSFTPRADLNTSRLMPETDIKNISMKVMKTAENANSTLYIIAAKHNGHQNKPISSYMATITDNNQLKIEKIHLPKGFLPRDILVWEDRYYLLASREFKEGNALYFHNSVFSIPANKNQPKKATEIQSFIYASFARSFEFINQCFYFGIGGEIENPKKWTHNEISIKTGDILKKCTHYSTK